MGQSSICESRSMIPLFLLLVVGAYLIGSVPTAYLVTKWRKGIDIRRFGSGNVGLSNAVATGSRWSSAVVVIFDLFKGMTLVFVARALDLEIYQQVSVGLAAISGHNWTIFLGFSGVRGALTTLGVVFALAPWLAVITIAFALVWVPFKQFALGVLIAGTLIPILSWFLNGPLQIDQSLSLTLGLAAITLLGITRRLTATRTEFWETVPVREILINRLLYDRDTSGREEWLNRTPPEMSSSKG